MKVLRAFVLLVAPISAALWLIPFYAYCWRAHGHLGRWPVSIRDHMDVAAIFPTHDSLVSVWFLLVFYLPVFWLAATLPMACLRVIRWREFLMGFGCWLPFLVAFIIDPGGLVWWFID